MGPEGSQVKDFSGRLTHTGGQVKTETAVSGKLWQSGKKECSRVVSGLFKPQPSPAPQGWGLVGSRSGNRLTVTAVTWEPLRTVNTNSRDN